MAKTSHVQATVLSYFEKYPGQRLHVGDVAKETGLTEIQVKSAVYQLTQKEDLRRHINVLFRGRVWEWHPKPEDRPVHKRVPRETDPDTRVQSAVPGEEVFILTKVGLGQQGIIAKDNDDAFWLLRKL